MGHLIRARSVETASCEQAELRRLKRAGVDAIDCSVGFDDQLTACNAAPALHRAADTAKAAGLRVVSVTLPSAGLWMRQPGVARDPATHDAATDDAPDGVIHPLQSMIEAAGEVGATVCNLAPPVQPERYRDALNGTHRTLAGLSLVAERRGVVAAVCAPGRGFLLSPVEVRELIDAAHGPGAGVAVDVDALASLGPGHDKLDPADRDRLDDWLAILGRRVVCIQGQPQALHQLDEAVKAFGAAHEIILVERWSSAAL